MNRIFTIIAFFSISYTFGMRLQTSPIPLAGTMVMHDSDYHLAGFASETMQAKTNKIFGADTLEKNDICIPVNILVQDFTPAHQVIDAMNPGLQKINLIKKLLKIKSGFMIACPIYKLQNNCELTPHVGPFSILCTFNQHNDLQSSINALNDNKPLHIFEYRKKITSDMFDSEISDRIFALVEDDVVNAEKLNDLLQEKEYLLQDLLRKRERMRQKDKDDSDITELATNLNLTTVFDFYDIPQYQQLCSLGTTNDSVVAFEVPLCTTNNLEANIRKRHLMNFKGRCQGNIFNLIHDGKSALKNFNSVQNKQ